MKIILLETIQGFGNEYDVIEAKDGFARYLINTNKAVFATSQALKKLQQQQAQQKKVDDKKMHEAKDLCAKIEQIKLEFSLKASQNQTFGTITTKNIIDCLAEKHHINIDKYMFIDSKKAYQVGKYIVKIKIYKDVIASLNINIIKEKK